MKSIAILIILLFYFATTAVLAISLIGITVLLQEDDNGNSSWFGFAEKLIDKL